MSKLILPVRAILGLVVVTSPCLAQNAPWPPPPGMSLGEYLRKYGGDELRRANPEFYRSLPEAREHPECRSARAQLEYRKIRNPLPC